MTTAKKTTGEQPILSQSALHAEQSRQYYSVLLHAVAHEDNKDNIERHALVLDKWIRENAEGYLVRDLQYIIQIFPVLRDRLNTHYSRFRDILRQVVTTGAKPLLESRSSERLKPESILVIKEFYREFSLFYNIPDLENAVEMTKSFRCILNGGISPYALKADHIPWESDGYKTQVVDKEFLQTMLREGCALDSIIGEFSRAMDVVGSVMETADTKPVHSEASTSDGQLQEGQDGTKGAESSVSPKTVVGENGRDGTQPEIQEWIIAILDLCFDVSKNPVSAGYMCKAGVCRGAIIFLNEYAAKNFRNPKVSECVDLMWTCMESYLEYADILVDSDMNVVMNVEVLDFEFALFVLRDVLFKIIHQGYRLADKELRNEIVIILTIIARFPRAIPCFIQSGLLEVLITYSTVAECGKDGWTFYLQPLAKIRNFGTAFDVDLHLKREMWVLISDLMKSDDEDVITSVAASPMIELLLIYLERSSIEQSHSYDHGYHYSADFDLCTLLPKEKESKEASGLALEFQSSRPQTAMTDVSSSDNVGHQSENAAIRAAANTFLGTISLPQLKEFQVIAIVFLAENACRVMGEFLRIDGPLRILQLIHLYRHSNIAEHKSIVFHAMILLNTFTVAIPSVIKPILEYQEVVKVLLDIFHEIDEEYIKSQSARLISNLCCGSPESIDQLKRMEGIDLLVKAILEYTKSRRVQVGKTAGVKLLGEVQQLEKDENDLKPGGDLTIFIVAVLDCVQNGIVGSVENEIQFAQEEGVDAVLDLLEVSPVLLRIKVLRLLSGLLENPQLMAFGHAWRSNRTMRSAAQIICHCWLDEEIRLGVCRDRTGLLANIFDPLKSHAWPEILGPQVFPSAAESIGGSSFESAEKIGTVDQSVFSNNTKAPRHHAPAKIEAGNISNHVRNEALAVDTRLILTRILELLMLLDSDVCFSTIAVKTSEGQGGQQEDFDEQFRQDQLQEQEVLDEADKQEEEKFPESSVVLDDEGVDMGEGYNDGYELENQQQQDELPQESFHELGDTNVNTSGKTTSFAELGLTPQDKQVISIAKRYNIMLNGEFWREVNDTLIAEGISPVDSDIAKIQYFLKERFNAASIVMLEHFELMEIEKSVKREESDAFINKILDQKTQQIKTEWFKKNARKHKTK